MTGGHYGLILPDVHYGLITPVVHYIRRHYRGLMLEKKTAFLDDCCQIENKIYINYIICYRPTFLTDIDKFIIIIYKLYKLNNLNEQEVYPSPQ